MSNLLFIDDNFIDSTYYDVVIHSGAWSNTLPLSNLMVDDLSQAAQSSSALETDTQYQVDLGTTRNVGIIVIPSSNGSNDATIQIDATNTAKFYGCTGGAICSVGDTSFSFKADSNGATITAGDVFTINGYTYKSNTTTSISALGTASISLATVSGFGWSQLQTTLTVGMEIVCNSGDFSTPVYDSGEFETIPQIYEFGELPFGHPSFWTGKPTTEQRLNGIYPIIKIPDNTVLARFWRTRVYDSGNIMGCVRLPRMFIGTYKQPTINAAYGASFGLQTETTRESSLGAIDTYDVKESRRIQGFTLENLPENEALISIYDSQKNLGIHKQSFFIFNPEDTIHMHRRSFTATLGNLNPLSYPYHSVMNAPGMEVREVLGGNMN